MSGKRLPQISNEYVAKDANKLLVLAISCSPLKILHTSALTIYQLQGNI
jgi:hypothetical protein